MESGETSNTVLKEGEMRLLLPFRATDNFFRTGTKGLTSHENESDDRHNKRSRPNEFITLIGHGDLRWI